MRVESLSGIAAGSVTHADVIVVVCSEHTLLSPAFQSEAERVSRRTPRVAVVSDAGPDVAAYVARLGWHGFAPANSTDDALLSMIEMAASGELAFPASATKALVRALARIAPVTTPSAALTPRQQQIVALIAQGATDAEIASVLGISRSTAHKHVQNARRRMRAKTRSQLVASTRGEAPAWGPS